MKEELIDKIGNSIIYLSDHCEGLHNKTYFLKMIYILDEVSIKETGIPFFNLNYELWEHGPVNRNLFQIKSNKNEVFNKYFVTEGDKVKAVAEFNDDEFSNNDLKILEKVCERFKYCTTEELVIYTHKQNSPWYIAAEELGLLDKKGNLTVRSTTKVLDMSSLIADNESKLFKYRMFKDSF